VHGEALSGAAVGISLTTAPSLGLGKLIPGRSRAVRDKTRWREIDGWCKVLKKADTTPGLSLLTMSLLRTCRTALPLSFDQSFLNFTGSSLFYLLVEIFTTWSWFYQRVSSSQMALGLYNSGNRMYALAMHDRIRLERIGHSINANIHAMQVQQGLSIDLVVLVV
jgi:hypothetical protein